VLVKVSPLLERFGDWREVLGKDGTDEALEVIRCHERTGRVLESERFVGRLERLVGREVKPGKPGRPRNPRAHGRDRSVVRGR